MQTSRRPQTPATEATGPLHHVLHTRGIESQAEGQIVLEHREALIYTLGKAAELEHLVMCQYLYAAFSLKRSETEGISADQAAAVKRWRHTLLEIAAQEMLHLALVQNLLTAVGGAPRFARPNFPLHPRSYPAGVQMALLPFGEQALRHFAFLERPEGMDIADDEEFAALAKATPLPRADEDEIGPHLQDFDTIGHLYRSIEDGLRHLAERMGEDGLFIGPSRAQATATHFRWKELVPVSDLASASRAIDTIVEQGEGARGDWQEAHFGRLIGVLDELTALRQADPDFEPTRPVLLSFVRPPDSDANVPIITAPFTIRCVDLMNAVYELVLQLLSRYFVNTDETDAQLGTLSDVAVGLMFAVVKPLGELVTRLEVGEEHPGMVAGPAFELFYAVDFLLPHRNAAWTVMEERMREVAELAVRCRDACIPTFLVPLSEITNALKRQADALALGR